MMLAGVLAVEGHIGYHPTWKCETCGELWPCHTFRGIPPERLNSEALLPVMSFMLRYAIRDLRGPGQEPREDVAKRFLWFLKLTDDGARDVARRLC